jgi:hypothetical protein
VAAVLLLAACVHNPAPAAWLHPPDRVLEDPYGAWIALRVRTDSQPVAGEFLAVTADTVWVHALDGAVRRVPTASVVHGRVAIYDARAWRFGVWTAVGIASTASHGIYLIFTAPLWGLVGTAATVGQARSAMVDIRSPTDWSRVERWARYPGGPPGTLPAWMPPRPL